uniref:Uncharacterized protein n=1 Tax=Anguilla anguilla TaxID=7936 RepID=A0A0E9XVL3_ANGAN
MDAGHQCPAPTRRGHVTERLVQNSVCGSEVIQPIVINFIIFFELFAALGDVSDLLQQFLCFWVVDWVLSITQRTY